MDNVNLSDVELLLVISATATVLLLAYFWSTRRNLKYPPCPLPVWPVVGNLLQLNREPQEQFTRFRKQCGDIYSLYLGTTNVVVLTGLDVLKEALVKNGINFSDRAVLYVDILTDTADSGISATNGAAWKEHRAFTTTMLKNTGLGNNLLCDKIQDEINHFIDLLESFKGEPKDVNEVTIASVTNVICSILLGQRYQYDDREFITVYKKMDNITTLLKDLFVLNYLRWLHFLPSFYFKCQNLKKDIYELFDIFDRYHVNVREGCVQETRNLIVAYFQEMNKKKLTSEESCMNKQSLRRLILDLFVAGTENSVNTFRWFFLYMVNYPDVQEKIFQEIKEVVGLERAPVMQDKTKLTYLMATIMEVQRLGSVVLQALPRVVTRDVKLRGYIIPKGIQIILHLEPVMYDPSLWGDDADKFRPERFIAKDGSLISPEAWIPFLIGKRSCVGEGMAVMELFLYVSNILQRFHILPAKSEEIPPLKRYYNFVSAPLPYVVRFVARSLD